MKSICFLAIKYIKHHYIKTSILLVCLFLTIIAPLFTYLVVNEYQQHLFRRCKDVPLILGSKGNDYDLLLRSLYYQGQYPGSISISWQDFNKAGKNIPLNLAFSGHKMLTQNAKYTPYVTIPIVGTTIDYFSFRNLQLKQGRLPIIMGEVAIGYQAAKNAQIQVGDFIVSDQKNVYDLSAAYPLKMKVVGILKQTYTSDDIAAFVDIKATWVMQGLIHGHEKTTTDIPKAKIREYTQITADNISAFHQHQNQSTITSLLIFPKNHKAKTILLAEYDQSEKHKLIQPLDVLNQLMSLIFRIQNLLHAYFILVISIVILFMTLIILLSLRIRKQEFHILQKMGCSRTTVYGMIFMEFTILLTISIITALAATYVCLNTISIQTILRFFL